MRRAILMLTVAMVTACGDDGGGAGADASPPDAPPEPAVGTCGIDSNVTRAQGNEVVFSRPDGSLLGTAVLTDGSARRDDCVDGTIVTMSLTSPPGLITLAGLERNSIARWGTIERDLFGNAEVSINPDGLPINGDSYEVTNGCTTVDATPGGPASTIGVTPLCAGRTGTDFDVVGIARDDTGTAVSYSFAQGITATPPTTTVDMTSAPWSPGASSGLVTVEEYDAEAGTAAVESAQLVDGVPFLSTLGLDNDELVAGTTTFLAPFVPEAIRGLTVVAGLVQRTEDGPASIQRLYFDAGTLRTIDMSTFLPRVSAPIVTLEDPARPTLRWSYDGDLAALDGIVAINAWDGVDAPNISWTVLTPAAESFQLPELPDSLASYLPAPGGVRASGFVIAFAEDWRDYADVLVDGTVLGSAAVFEGRLTLTEATVEGRTDLSLSSRPSSEGGGGIIIDP